MKKRGLAGDEGAHPEAERRGSYPPDVARLRRKYGLPVTPEEHVRYDAGQLGDPPITSAQMAVTLADGGTALHRRPSAAFFLEIAARIEARQLVPPALAKQAGPLGEAIRAVQRRERTPGEEG